jgi:hypothetical protein
MKKALIIALLCLAVAVPSEAGFLDDLFKEVTAPLDEEEQGLSEGTIIDGLKEALSVAISEIQKLKSPSPKRFARWQMC